MNHKNRITMVFDQEESNGSGKKFEKYQIRTNSRDPTGRAITNFVNNTLLRSHILLISRLYQNYRLLVTKIFL